MPDVVETELPGVGTRYDFTTRAADRVAVIVHRSGRREIMIYDRDDPDACRTALELTADDALTLVEVLGASRVVESLSAMQVELPGLAIDWLTIAATSQWAGHTLAEAAVHTRTGVSIVAVIRGNDAIHAPGADTELHSGDRVVAIGTPDGVARLARELGGD